MAPKKIKEKHTKKVPESFRRNGENLAETERSHHRGLKPARTRESDAKRPREIVATTERERPEMQRR